MERKNGHSYSEVTAGKENTIHRIYILHIMSSSYVIKTQAGLIEHEVQKWRPISEPPADELEVMRPEHFILPTWILVVGLTAASITFLCEILINRSFK